MKKFVVKEKFSLNASTQQGASYRKVLLASDVIEILGEEGNKYSVSVNGEKFLAPKVAIDNNKWIENADGAKKEEPADVKKDTDENKAADDAAKDEAEKQKAIDQKTAADIDGAVKLRKDGKYPEAIVILKAVPQESKYSKRALKELEIANRKAAADKAAEQPKPAEKPPESGVPAK